MPFLHAKLSAAYHTLRDAQEVSDSSARMSLCVAKIVNICTRLRLTRHTCQNPTLHRWCARICTFVCADHAFESRAHSLTIFSQLALPDLAKQLLVTRHSADNVYISVYSCCAAWF